MWISGCCQMLIVKELHVFEVNVTFGIITFELNGTGSCVLSLDVLPACIYQYVVKRSGWNLNVACLGAYPAKYHHT